VVILCYPKKKSICDANAQASQKTPAQNILILFMIINEFISQGGNDAVFRHFVRVILHIPTNK
jgi:hypothetical protein